MDDSLVLLSTMSPKITKNMKPMRRKFPTKLATKKHFRRSSILEQHRKSIVNESVITISSSSSSSASYCESEAEAAVAAPAPHPVPHPAPHPVPHPAPSKIATAEVAATSHPVPAPASRRIPISRPVTAPHTVPAPVPPKIVSRTTVVVIPDSESDDDQQDESDEAMAAAAQLRLEYLRKLEATTPPRRTSAKYADIEQWVEQVNQITTTSTGKKSVAFSEVSTVYGDETNPNFRQPHTLVAASSTTVFNGSPRFDQLFKRKPTSRAKQLVEQSKGPSTETASYEPAEGILKGHLVQDSYQLNKGRAREFEMSTTSDTLTGTFTSSVHKIAPDNNAANIEKCPGKRKLKELNLSDEYLRDSFAQMQIRNSLELLNNRNRAGNVEASFETHNDVISDSFEENNDQLPISSGIQHNSLTNKNQPAVEVGDVNTENKENICANSDVISDSQSLKPKKNTKRLLTANDVSKISIDLLTFRSTTINESRSTDSAHKPPESVDIVSDSESLRLKRRYYCPNNNDSTVSIELLTPKNLTLQLSSKTVQRKVGLRDQRPQLRTGQRQNSGEVSTNSDAVISDSLSARLMKYAEANDDHDDVTPVSTNFLNLHESSVSPADPKKTTFSDSFQKLDGNSPSPETDNRDPQKTTFSDSFQKTEVDSPDIISNSESPRLFPKPSHQGNNRKEPDLGDLDPSLYTFRSSTATSNIVREADLADKTTRSYMVTGDSETPPKSDSFKESRELRTLKTGGAKTSADSKFPQNRPEKDNDSDATNVSVDFLNLQKLSVSPASPKKTTFSDSFQETEVDSPDIISNSESPQVQIDILANHRRSDSNFADRTTKTNIITGNSEQLTTTRSNGNNESSQSSKAKGSKTKTNSGKSKKPVNGKLPKNTGLSSNPAEIQQKFADLDPSQYTFRSSTTTSNSDGANFAEKTTRSNIITGTGELSTLTRENSDSCQKSRESSDFPTFKTNSTTKSKSTKKNSNTESSSLVGSADVINDSQPSDRNLNSPKFPTRKKQNPPNNEETDNNKKSAITKNDSASGDDIFQNIRSNLQSGFVKMTNQFITADSFDESFNLQLEDSLSNGLQTKQGSSSKNNDNSEVGQKDSSDREFQTPGNNATSEAEMEHLLDSLYGKSWRENRENILPASEPRLKTSARGKTKADAPNTERKPKPSLTHKNPYLITERNKTNSLRKIIHKARVDQALESPWVRSLKNICDSDTSSSDSEDTGPSGGRIRDDSDSDDINNDIDNNNDAVARQPVPRVKLTFDIEDDDSQQDQNLRDDNNSDHDVSSKGTSGTRTLTATPCISEFPSSEENPPQLTISSTQTNTEDVNFQATDLKTKVTTTTTIDNGKVQKKVVKGTTPKKGTPKRGKGGRGPLKAIHEINTRLRTPKKETKSDNDEDDWYPIDDGKQKTKAVGSRRTRSKSKLGPLQRNGTYSFLASLSGRVPDSQCDPSARIFLANFKHYRDPLTQKLFKLYNEKVFANAIPQDTPLVWNDRMRRTAGFCYCRKITRRTGAVERKARIALSTKVLDSADRLCNTLIHEMCHAATWIVDGVTDQHGPVWRGWADRAMKTFPELPPIKRCHEYVINTKYTYRCVDCGYSIGRHSKSLDVDRKRCGHCMGKFELLINKVTKHGEAKSVPVTPKRQATGFALFVKENYANHKTPDLKHGDIMRILGQKFSAMKVSQT